MTCINSMVHFVLNNCVAIAGIGHAKEILENEEFETAKYDLRPCAAAFLSSLYENSAPQLQNALKCFSQTILLTPMTSASPSSLLLQVLPT